MLLELGKWYKTRDGSRIAFVQYIDKEKKNYPAQAKTIHLETGSMEFEHYELSGAFHLWKEENKLDLVEELKFA